MGIFSFFTRSARRERLIRRAESRLGQAEAALRFWREFHATYPDDLAGAACLGTARIDRDDALREVNERKRLVP